MKNLVNKLKDGAKKVGKVIAPVAAGAILATSNVNAQNIGSNHDYSRHDKGAEFRGYTINSNDLLEEKVFYNPGTGKDERFYIQHLDKEGKKLSENDLDIAALPFYKSKPMIDMKSGKVSHILAEEVYRFFPIERTSVAIPTTHVGDRCDNQIRTKKYTSEEIYSALSNPQINSIAQEIRESAGNNYISTSYVKDYIKALSDDMVLELGDGQEFLILRLPKELQEEGKTNQLYVPIDNDHQWSVDPVTKDIHVYGKIYRGFRETYADSDSSYKSVPAVVPATTGEVKFLDEGGLEKQVVDDANDVAKKEKNKKANFYFITGVNASPSDFEENQPSIVNAELGLGYGPLAVVGNFGKGFSDVQTIAPVREVNPTNGRVFTGEEYMTNVRNWDVNLETHLRNNKNLSFVLGAGYGKLNYNLEGNETLATENGTVLKDDNYNLPISETNYNLNGGVDIKIGKKSKLGYTARYKLGEQDLRDGNFNNGKFYHGVRFTRKIGKR